jgi:FHS family glucose/mannose:H+ symporter-like MFS transporter
MEKPTVTEKMEKAEMAEIRVNRGLLFGGAAAGIFVFGIVMAILGTLFGLPEMRGRLRIDLAGQGSIILLLYAGIFAATVIAGPVIDAIGNKVILVVSSALVAGAMVGFAYAHSYGSVVGPAVLLGFGGGGINISANALVSDVYGEKRGAMLNVLGTFYGIGALCIPLLAAVIEGHFTIAQMLMVCAGLAALCAVVFAAMRFPATHAAQSFSWREALRVARYPGVLAIGLMLFCQSGNEACVGGWTSTYAGTAGIGARTATLILAGFWAALMVGRLVVARALTFVGKKELVVWSAVGAVVGAGILLATPASMGQVRAEWMLAAGVVVLGLSYAGIFPTALAIAGDEYRKMAGTVFGLLFAIALVGGMTFPWAVGEISQDAGVRLGMIVPLSGAVGILGLALRRGVGQKIENGK